MKSLLCKLCPLFSFYVVVFSMNWYFELIRFPYIQWFLSPFTICLHSHSRFLLGYIEHTRPEITLTYLWLKSSWKCPCPVSPAATRQNIQPYVSIILLTGSLRRSQSLTHVKNSFPEKYFAAYFNFNLWSGRTVNANCSLMHIFSYILIFCQVYCIIWLEDPGFPTLSFTFKD